MTVCPLLEIKILVWIDFCAYLHPGKPNLNLSQPRNNIRVKKKLMLKQESNL